MFDVLVYLYETYWRPDACPDHAQLARKLTAVGFENDEIQEALSWLDGLAAAGGSYEGEQSPHALRLYSAAEVEHLGETSIGFISFLENSGSLSPVLREILIEAAQAADHSPLSLAEIKVLALMVLWSQEAEVDHLVFEELLTDDEGRQSH